MVAATVNSVTTSFAYRGDGLRDSRAVSSGATTQFTWDIASGLPVVLDDGNQYLYGAGLTAMKQSGSWYYYLADGLGSTMAIVDSSGNSQKSYTYDVYGEATPSGGLANEFDFAGQHTDGTGLQYLRARYYDPEVGTFLSRDPLASLLGWSANSHSYGNGAPTRWTDPLGLCSTWFPSCWQTVDPELLGVTLGDSSSFFEALFIGKFQLPFYRFCRSLPDGEKDCGSAYSQDEWLDWIYHNVPTAIGATQVVLDVAEYIRSHGRTPWGGKSKPFENDGRDETERLPDIDPNTGQGVSYREWDAVQPGRGGRGGERVVTGSDGSTWYTDNHYKPGSWTRLK